LERLARFSLKKGLKLKRQKTEIVRFRKRSGRMSRLEMEKEKNRRSKGIWGLNQVIDSTL